MKLFPNNLHASNHASKYCACEMESSYIDQTSCYFKVIKFVPLLSFWFLNVKRCSVLQKQLVISPLFAEIYRCIFGFCRRDCFEGGAAPPSRNAPAFKLQVLYLCSIANQRIACIAGCQKTVLLPFSLYFSGTCPPVKEIQDWLRA